MIKAEQIHCGQYKKYDDFHRIWTIETDEPRESVLKYCFSELHNKSYEVPPSAEWHDNIRYGGEKSGDMSYYFRGYYDLVKLSRDGESPDVYKFEIVEPYAD